MAWRIKTKTGCTLHNKEGWVFPIRWMRGLRTAYFFIGVMRCDEPKKIVKNYIK